MKTNKTSTSMRRLGEVTAALAFVAGSLAIAAPISAADSTVNLTATNQFEPANVTVAVGDTVTFVWQGGFHDVTFADGVSSGAPVGIDGTTYARTFDAPGSYGYVCTVHESGGMVGTVVVEGAAAATTTAPAAGATTIAGGGGSGGDNGMPYTGPERSLLPLLGIGLMAGGLALRVRLRKAG